jgi:Flp pilus assembly protein TadG
MRPAPCARHGPCDDRGSATIEMAIAFPVVIALLMMVVQAGVYFHTRAVATTAAHKGLDALRVEEGSTPAAVAATEDFLDRNAAALDSRVVGVDRTGEMAEVTVSGDVVSLIFGVDLFPVTVTATAPIEQVTP